MVGQLLQVALDVAGGQTAAAAGEDGVYGVPGQQGAVVAAADAGLVAAVGEHRRHAGQHPGLGVGDVVEVFGALEVVEIRGIVLRAAGLAGNEVGKLAGERDARRLGAVQQGQLVQHVGEPLALLLPVQVQAPDGVVQRLLAHVHLGGEGLLGQVHEGTAEGEVLGEVVLPVHAQHGLALHAVVGVVLVRDGHALLRVEDALVQDGHLAGRIVDAVVAALLQLYAAGHHLHRAAGHVVGTQRLDRATAALELAGHDVLVFLGVLLGHRLGRVIQLVKAVDVGQMAHALAL